MWHRKKEAINYQRKLTISGDDKMPLSDHRSLILQMLPIKEEVNPLDEKLSKWTWYKMMQWTRNT